MPELPGGAVVGVEGIHTVVLCGDEDDVADAEPGDVQVRDVQRLRVDVSVNGIGEQVSERPGDDVGRSQHGLGEVLAGAGVVVALREHADLRARHMRAQEEQRKRERQRDRTPDRFGHHLRVDGGRAALIRRCR